MKILGIDYGEKRIGVALSDEQSKIAFPYSVLENKGNIVEAVQNIQKKEGFTDVVVGDPGPNALKEKVTSFVKALENEGFRVFLEKEFMTSLHTDMFTKTKPIARQSKQVREVKKDESAAALILQRFLDKQAFKK